jgi:hypothetical protein
MKSSDRSFFGRIERKAYCCDICRVPESINNNIHVTYLGQFLCDGCYNYWKKHGNLTEVPYLPKYKGMDSEFWKCKYFMKEKFNFDALLDTNCKKCGKDASFGDDMFHIITVNGIATEVQCERCYIN